MKCKILSISNLMSFDKCTHLCSAYLTQDYKILLLSKNLPQMPFQLIPHTISLNSFRVNYTVDFLF